MKKTRISEFWFYKYRYQISYAVLFISYLAIILYALFVAPNGITTQEISSSEASFRISLDNIFSSEIINLPYKILQSLSISTLGLSNFSIKLPSVLLSIAALFGIIKLTHKWFTPGIATLASIIGLSSSQFFFLSQNGTPEILYILYPILLLLAGAKFITAKKRFLLVVSASILMGLSLYTPLGIYILLALAITVALHPHLRLMIKRSNRRQLTLGGVIFVVIVTPLIIATINDLSIVGQLLGLPEQFNIIDNFRILIAQLFSFSAQETSGVVFPVIDLASIILIGVGIFYTFSARWTSRSYLVNIWGVILLVACLINPDSITILFTPILVLMISGLQSLVQTWYTLFPQNPYARVSGLIPVVVVVVSLLLTNLDNFRLNYIYSPEVLNNFSQDLIFLNEEIMPEDALVVTSSEQDFYTILANQKSVPISETLDQPANRFIISKDAFENIELGQNQQISQIITSTRLGSADRFYVVETRSQEVDS